MKKTIALLCVLVPLVSGCASSGPPVATAQMTETELAIRSAENAGAAEGAPDFLDRAQKAFAAARAASARGDYEESRRLLEEAKAYAGAAEARSSAEKLKRQAADLRQQADELESKAKQLKERARP
jgi:predicted lipid-binding transport protein (Tim44 family)